MMATVQLLWDQKEDHEERLATADAVIDNLQRHIDELGVAASLFRMRTRG
jgi:hypothetical protein